MPHHMATNGPTLSSYLSINLSHARTVCAYERICYICNQVRTYPILVKSFSILFSKIHFLTTGHLALLIHTYIYHFLTCHPILLYGPALLFDHPEWHKKRLSHTTRHFIIMSNMATRLTSSSNKCNNYPQIHFWILNPFYIEFMSS